MRGHLFSAMLALALIGAGCASHANPSVTSADQASRLTSATVTFTSLADGKDADSAINVQLLRDSNELAADTSSKGSDFDDDSTAPPLAMTINGPFSERDTATGRLRLRLTPDGDDTWTFNVQLALSFDDSTQQHYQWQAVRLDEKAPERTLVLEGARQ